MGLKDSPLRVLIDCFQELKKCALWRLPAHLGFGIRGLLIPCASATVVATTTCQAVDMVRGSKLELALSVPLLCPRHFWAR
jgi:hypothetical protein